MESDLGVGRSVGSTGEASGLERTAPAGDWRDPNVAYVVMVFLAIKVGLLSVILLGSQLLPFNLSLYEVNSVWPLRGLSDLFRPFNTWDTQQYLLLAEQGYGTNPFSDNFYPLYPFAIRALKPVFLGSGLAAAWAIANVVSLLVPVYMYRLARLFWPAKQAVGIVLLLLAFPTGFFLSMAYAESLYLALCLMGLFYLLRKQVVLASICCFLLPLARAQALLFMVPVVVLFLQTALRPKGDIREALRAYLLPAIAAMAGVAAYLLFCLWQLGDPFAGLNAQRFSIAGNSLENLLHPVEWFRRNFVDISLSLHNYTTSWIDRALFVVALPLLVGVWRTQHKALFAYALVTLLVPALAGSFMSYSRHLMLVFPLFMYLGTALPRPELLAIPMFAIQILLVLMHTGGYWVA